MRTVLMMAGMGLTAALAAGCGGDDGAPAGRPSVVVSSGLLGDVVAHLVGDDADVEVLMPPGTDPHDFAPSARQAAALRAADVVVVNGLGFEEGLQSAVDAAAADGVLVLAAGDEVEALPLAGGGAGARDPHFFTDPRRMGVAAAALARALAQELPALTTPTAEARIDGYLTELQRLDAEVEAILATVPPTRRLLVTNHEVLGYFADRYGFELVGVIIPGGATLAEPSAADLARLANLVRDRAVPAVFADTSSPARLAEALAAEGSPVPVVALYSESLGEAGSGADTYIGMMRTNAERIAEALR